MIRFGIDSAELSARIPGRAALVTAPSGRSFDNRSSIDVLKDVCDLVLLLAPEHGVRGDKAAGEVFSDGVDALSGLRVKSLYRPGSKRLAPETAEEFDTLVYDIQDVGCRYYTFISTLKNLLYDCAEHGKRLVVLDRPDPLGRTAEGTVTEPGAESFVGCAAIPVRYGLTCGEFARMINAEERIGCALDIVRCEGYDPLAAFPGWDRPWVMPSLAMPRLDTALLYPGTCLLEGTNLSEGRGTADPFAILGAPFIDAERLCRELEALRLPGLAAAPVFFTPTASKHAGTLCGGVHLHVTDAGALQSVELGIRLLDILRRDYPDDFAFLPPVRPDGRPFISLLAGHREFERPDWDAEALIERGRRESAAFEARRGAYLLY